MKLVRGWKFRTEHGVWQIRASGRSWVVLFEAEVLGSYLNMMAALDDLVGGHTKWPSCGNPALCGLTDDFGKWEPIRRY